MRSTRDTHPIPHATGTAPGTPDTGPATARGSETVAWWHGPSVASHRANRAPAPARVSCVVKLNPNRDRVAVGQVEVRHERHRSNSRIRLGTGRYHGQWLVLPKIICSTPFIVLQRAAYGPFSQR